jgi:hypothetical protein
MIKKFKMDWESEQHSFIFEGCDRLSDVDMLNDLIQSLEHLRKHIGENFSLTEDTTVFYVTGGYDFTHIEETS